MKIGNINSFHLSFDYINLDVEDKSDKKYTHFIEKK